MENQIKWAGHVREWRNIASPDKDSRRIRRGRQEEKRKTATETGGLREKRRQEYRSRRKLEGKEHDS